MVGEHHLSERRACRLVGLSRDSFRHPPEPDQATVELSGKIVEVRGAENMQVKAGDLLFRIDPEPYQLQIQQANAAIASAQANQVALSNASALSGAEISGAQDFSTFPGIDRVIVQLDGPRMVLTIGGMPHPLTPLAPLPFAGEAQVSCALDGDARAHDLNLMCLRSDYRPAMVRRVVEDGAVAARAPKGGVAAVMALSDCALIAGEEYRLGPQDLLLMRDGAEAVALGAADVMVMTAEPAAR